MKGRSDGETNQGRKCTTSIHCFTTSPRDYKTYTTLYQQPSPRHLIMSQLSEYQSSQSDYEYEDDPSTVAQRSEIGRMRQRQRLRIHDYTDQGDPQRCVGDEVGYDEYTTSQGEFAVSSLRSS